MKCPRCHNEMPNLEIENKLKKSFICFSDGCPISQYETFDNGDYTGSITFEKYPSIFTETGMKNGKPFTKIMQHYLDDPMSFTTSRTLYEFDKEMMDMTIEKLKTILVFG